MGIPVVTDTAVAMSKSCDLSANSSAKARLMTSKPNKSVLATFRLSREDYEESKRACNGLGYRSFSEFAREAVLSRIRSGQGPEKTQTDAMLDHLDQAANQVCSLLRQICDRIGAHEEKKG
jgi:hypothetical protein